MRRWYRAKPASERRRKRARELGIPVDELPDGRGRHGNHAQGADHPRWQGGRIVAANGYVKVRVGKDHHLADVIGNAYEHRLVAEEMLGRRLSADEEVHHLNGDKTDNCQANLQVLTATEHAELHANRRSRDVSGRFA